MSAHRDWTVRNKDPPPESSTPVFLQSQQIHRELMPGGEPLSALSPRRFTLSHESCEKHTPWSKPSKWTRRQRGQQSEASVTVLQDQDWEAGERATLGQWGQMIYPLAREPLPCPLTG